MHLKRLFLFLKSKEFGKSSLFLFFVFTYAPLLHSNAIIDRIHFCLESLRLKNRPQFQIYPDTPEVIAARAVLKKIPVYKDIFEALQQEELDPEILKNRMPFTEKAEGMGFKNLEVAEIGNPPQKVFIKTMSTKEKLDGRIEYGLRNMDQVLNQIFWAKFNSEMGWGPKYRGLIRAPDSNVAIVFDYVPGTHMSTHLYKMPALTLSAKKAAYAKLDEMSRIFTALRIGTHDLQYRIDPEGRFHVIDSEFFKIWQNPYPYSFEEAEARGRLTFPKFDDPRYLISTMKRRIESAPVKEEP